MTGQHEGKGMKHDETSLSKGVEIVQQNSVFGRYSEVDMIAQLKGFAQDPCMERDNIQPLYEQILRVRKLMILRDSEIPWRKRKLEQFVKDKLRSPLSTALPNQKNVIQRNRRQSSHASSVSCLLNSIDSTTMYPDEKINLDSCTSGSLLSFENDLVENQVSAEYSFQDDVELLNSLSTDKSSTTDSDESVSDSKSQSPETYHSKSPTMGAHSRNHQPPRRSIRLLNFIGDHLQRKAIPVGPRFQADVPEWNGPLSTYSSDSDHPKWLGSQVWPIEIGNMENAGKTIGTGRPDSCCCVDPLSVDCIRRHILEERLLLQRELGPAFIFWKFDEMGEQISESWSLKEQETFESLVKAKSSSKKKSFLKRALKCFSNKHRKDIVNYYFNVYVPQHMSLRTRSASLKQVDTDDEEPQDCNYLGLKKKKI